MTERQPQLTMADRFATAWEDFSLNDQIPVADLDRVVTERQQELALQNSQTSEISAFCEILSRVGLAPKQRVYFVGLRYGVQFPTSLV